MKERVKKSIIILCIGIAVNITLAVVKMYVGLSSNSLCIMLDATNSFLDILTCIITVIAFAVLFAPRSERAPFGYGRSEYLAGFIVAVVSVVMGGLFFIRSLNRLAMPEPVWFGWENCVLISVAVPIKLGLGLFYYFSNRKLQSKAIAALVLDSFLDIGITSASLISFAISSQVDYAVDAIFGIVISILVVVFAVRMMLESVRCVVKGDGGEEERELIEKRCGECERIERVVRVTLHDYGFGAKAGTAEVVFKNGVTLGEAERIGRELYDVLEAECGVQLWIVPCTAADVEENPTIGNEIQEAKSVRYIENEACRGTDSGNTASAESCAEQGGERRTSAE